MKPRSCSHLHFVQAIRAGVVVKVRNVDSSGRPALVFKKLEDIYEREDAKKRDSLSTLQPQDRHADMVFDSDRIITENTRLPSIERKTKKRESNTDTSYRDSDDEEEGTDGLNSGKMTLKQLKEQCKKKKRKVLHSAYLSPKQDCTDQQPEENECDLQEPISSWKSKLPKILKGKKKCAKKCASLCSQTEVSVKSAQIPSAEDAVQSSGYLSALVNVKVEVPETGYPECSNMMSISDDTSNCSIEPLGLCGEVLDEILQPVKPEVDLGEEISLTEDESRNCAVNEICFDHLEHIEPNYLLPSIVGEIMEADNLKKTCQRSLVFPALEKEGHIVHTPLEESSAETIFHFNDQGSDICNNLEINSSVHERSSQISGVCGVQVPDMAMDSSLCCVGLTSGHFLDDINGSLPPNLEMDSLSSPLSKYNASWNSNHCSSPEVVLVSADDNSFATEKPPLMSDSVDEARNYLSPHKNPVSSEGVLSTEEEKQPLMFSPDCAESNSSERSHPCDVGVKSSMPEIMSTYNLEQYHPPERLLSTRKAISPISQEKLCQAMKGTELNDKIDNYKCKDKLQFMIETEKNASPAGPGTDGAQVNSNPEGLGEVTRTLVAMSSKQMNKKPRTDRKGSPHKGFRRGGPHFSGSLPHVSTGATSIQSCSERAIAFSQRQMHDIEGLAMKLMQELKFMKDVVEGQVHSEASPAKFLKYDMDEVKTAIKSATQVEETTKKWLSMMARDCNRFCKLMRLNEKGEIAPGNAIHRERKKITFADEAGGVLCHVKFIDDSKDSLDSES